MSIAEINKALFMDFFWFYGASIKFMGHQSKIKTFFQAIPKSFVFVKEQSEYYKSYRV